MKKYLFWWLTVQKLLKNNFLKVICELSISFDVNLIKKIRITIAHY